MGHTADRMMMGTPDTIGRKIRSIMNFIQGQFHSSGMRPVFRKSVAALSLLLATSGLSPVQAQTETYIDYTHPNITVDLSVLGDGGLRDSSTLMGTPPGSTSNRSLLVPGNRAPTSMLHVPTVSGKILAPVVKRKKVKRAAAAPMPAPIPVVKEAPPPEPAPVIANAPEKTAPPPKPVPVAKVSSAPTKLEAPKKPAIEQPVATAETSSAPPPVPSVAMTTKAEPALEPKTPAPPPTPAVTKKKPTATQQAALPVKTETDGSPGNVRVAFGAEQTKLPDGAKKKLVALAKSLEGKEDKRIQLMAYAGGESLSSSLARRMSLSRALSIRSFLIENGVRSTRIDVRALGNKTSEKPFNRVDLNVTTR